VVEQHAVVGDLILARVAELDHVRPIVRACHERWDGCGYPDGLAADQIPLEARIIFACDAYHAMITDRPYRRRLSTEEAAGRLRARWVLHGAVMGQDLQTSADLVERTTRSCLELADELGARSLALPAFGTGVGGFPLDECARIMVRVARAYEPVALERVIFAVFGDEARRAF